MAFTDQRSINSNAAGILGPHTNITLMDVGGFEKCLKVNTIGTLNCIQAYGAQMLLQDPLPTFVLNSPTLGICPDQAGCYSGNPCLPPQRGAIVNFASVNSILGGHGTSAYTASKHAVVGLTKSVRTI